MMWSVGFSGEFDVGGRRRTVAERQPGSGRELQELRPGGTPPSRPSRRRACGRNTSSLSTKPVDSASRRGAATETPPLASVGDSKRSIETSEVSSPPYPCGPATENGFHNNWRSAKPSNPGPSSGSSRFNGRRFRRLRTPAHGVISSPVAPHTATLVRFDFYGDQSESEAVPTKKESCEMRGDGVETQMGDPNAV